MTISTMEELEAMPSGSSIRVDSASGSTWTFKRTENGWSREGAEVPVRFFSGYVTAGKVADASKLAPRVNDWWRTQRYWFFIRSVSEQGMVKALRFQRTVPAAPPFLGEWHTDALMGSRTARMEDVPPEVLNVEVFKWLATQWETAEATLAQVRQERESITEERNILKNRPEPARLEQALVGVDAALMQLRQLIGGGST